MRFYEESVFPNRKVGCFPTNKPWIDRDDKFVLKMKKAFMTVYNGNDQKTNPERAVEGPEEG